MIGPSSGIPPVARTGREPASAELIAWRWRALKQQLPAASFPAGSAAPSLVFLWASMLLAVAAAFGFAIHDQRRVPAAVQDSQRDIAVKVARTMNAGVDRSVEELAPTLDTLRTAPADQATAVLPRIVGDGQTWTGAAVLDTATRKPLATAGAAVPVDALPAPLPADEVVAVSTPEAPTVVLTATLEGGRTMAAVQPLLMRNLRLNPDARHGVFMLTPDGQVTLMQGVSTVDSRAVSVVLAGFVDIESSTSQLVDVAEWRDRQLVVSAAPVGDTGVVVASMIVSPVAEGTSFLRGVLLGGSLLLVALISFILMRVCLVRPVRALLRQGMADACGAETEHRRSLRIAEAYRIAHALAVSSGAGLRARRWRPTAMQGLSAAAVLALLWPAGAVATTLGADSPRIPAQLVYDEESRAEAAATALGNALDAGLGAVARISRAVREPVDHDRIERALRGALAEDRRLRGLYLVNAEGQVLRSAGRSILRSAEPLSGEVGIRLDPAIERLPVLYAYRVNVDGTAVVGEFDIDYLLGLVRQVHGRASVVDADLRTLLDSEGYRAFQPLVGDTAREAAVEAFAGTTVGRSSTSVGEPALVAASPLLSPGSVAHLELVVVVERNIAVLALPDIVGHRWTLLLAGTMAGIVAVIMTWHFYIFVRPLRRLAAAADKMCVGKLEEPIPPQRHDDIGAIAMCLEICRQVRHTGSARFGGAIRLRGSEGNFTAVLPRVPRQRTNDRAARV